MKEIIYTKVCAYCASEFQSSVRNARLCPVCKSFSTAGEDKPRRRRRSGKSIQAFCAEVENYNRAHGTCLTYGQYSALSLRGAQAKRGRA